jgi:SAM-dependent methyltransferase
MKNQVDVDGNTSMAIRSEFNGYTVAGYEGCALDYAISTIPKPGGNESPALKKLLKVLDQDCRLLEIGSGPGWDADWLEAKGPHVRRTDAAEAFVDFQNSRGKFAERLDVLNDRLGVPYDVIIALYVLQHIDRHALPLVFQKLSHAVRGGGSFLFSIREGHGQIVEKDSKGGSYYIALWQLSELVAELTPLGFRLIWSESSVDTEGKWLNVLFKNYSQETGANS